MLEVLIIGAGINGAGIARDLAGRGRTVALVDKGDIGGGTSSASTKLIHGGLRYLELYEFGLVRKALAEREVLLHIAPHLAWPLAFVLPHAPELRPRWMIRAGLFLYDHLAARREVPGSNGIDLARDPAGAGLANRAARGFRYWDGWVDDARLVVANARDAARMGAQVILRDGVNAARREGEGEGDGWAVTLASGRTLRARFIVNAAGPWAEQVARGVLGVNDTPRVNLVQGAHLVTRRVNPTEDAYILQGADRRIVFVIPYEQEYSLIGTTERAIDDPADAACTPDEEAYLLAAANRWLAAPLGPGDVVHRFAGVRPLIAEDGKSERETTRDWRLVAHGANALTIVGGKLTTYRLLAEEVAARLAPGTADWTAGVPLPGGALPGLAEDGAVAAFAQFEAGLGRAHPGVPAATVHGLARRHGTEAEPILAHPGDDLGGMFEAELDHLRTHEWAVSAEDALWRRTKLGLHLDATARARVTAWFGG